MLSRGYDVGQRGAEGREGELYRQEPWKHNILSIFCIFRRHGLNDPLSPHFAILPYP